LVAAQFERAFESSIHRVGRRLTPFSSATWRRPGRELDATSPCWLFFSGTTPTVTGLSTSSRFIGPGLERGTAIAAKGKNLPFWKNKKNSKFHNFRKFRCEEKEQYLKIQ
jgi:hypothetical protein